VLLPIVAAADLGAWGYFYVWRERPASVARIAIRAEPPRGWPGDLVYTLEPSNLPVLAGYRVTNGYVALSPRRAVEVDNPIAQRLAGVDWRKNLRTWERVVDRMPRARIVHQVSVARRNVGPAVAQIDLDRSVVVPMPIDVDAVQDADDVRVVVDRPGRISIGTRTSGRGVLVITERYHEGWRARSSDGRPLPVIRANGDFLGCVVDPGVSEVRLTFAPRSLRVGAWITVATLGMLLLPVAMSWRRSATAPN
jgi:Bacterial membrane protein YfhO